MMSELEELLSIGMPARWEWIISYGAGVWWAEIAWMRDGDCAPLVKHGGCGDTLLEAVREAVEEYTASYEDTTVTIACAEHLHPETRRALARLAMAAIEMIRKRQGGE